MMTTNVVTTSATAVTTCNGAREYRAVVHACGATATRGKNHATPRDRATSPSYRTCSCFDATAYVHKRPACLPACLRAPACLQRRTATALRSPIEPSCGHLRFAPRARPAGRPPCTRWWPGAGLFPPAPRSSPSSARFVLAPRPSSPSSVWCPFPCPHWAPPPLPWAVRLTARFNCRQLHTWANRHAKPIIRRRKSDGDAGDDGETGLRHRVYLWWN